MSRRTSARASRATVAAERVFTGDDPIRVLLAGPGQGKSTLLRQFLRSASRRLLTTEAGSASSTLFFPVLIRAGALAGAPLLAPALAHAVTEEYGPFGLSEVLTEDFFRRPPCPGARWLVMVDGLDEVPDRTARLSLLDRLAREAGQMNTPYRFLVATRPCPAANSTDCPAPPTISRWSPSPMTTCARTCANVCALCLIPTVTSGCSWTVSAEPGWRSWRVSR
ncbi:hypothetical protein ACWF95_31755 [Streptomyces vinaceus]